MKRPNAVEKTVIEYLARRDVPRAFADAAAVRRAIEAKFPGAIARQKERDAKETFDRKFVGNVPAWARHYVEKYGSRVDTLTIRRSRSKDTTSGRCYGGSRLVVTFGREKPGDDIENARREKDWRTVVLHEIAHSRAPYDDHGDRFYAEFRKMLVAEGLLRFAQERYGKIRAGKLRQVASRGR